MVHLKTFMIFCMFLALLCILVYTPILGLCILGVCVGALFYCLIYILVSEFGG